MAVHTEGLQLVVRLTWIALVWAGSALVAGRVNDRTN